MTPQTIAILIAIGAVAIVGGGRAYSWLKSRPATQSDESDLLMGDFAALERLEERGERLANVKIKEACIDIREAFLVEGQHLEGV